MLNAVDGDAESDAGVDAHHRRPNLHNLVDLATTGLLPQRRLRAVAPKKKPEYFVCQNTSFRKVSSTQSA